jgi:hypothetical protein
MTERDAGHAANLIKVMRGSGQEVPPELAEMARARTGGSGGNRGGYGGEAPLTVAFLIFHSCFFVWFFVHSSCFSVGMERSWLEHRLKGLVGLRISYWGWAQF